jgi:hypothetical protein
VKSDKERIAELEGEVQKLKAQLLDALTKPTYIYPYVPCTRPHYDWTWSTTSGTTTWKPEIGTITYDNS